MGVRRENRVLFERLASVDDSAERGRVFDDYMNVKFYLHDWRSHETSARQSLKNSYLRFLRGWGVHLADPSNPSVLTDVERAAQLDPNEALFKHSLEYLRK